MRLRRFRLGLVALCLVGGLWGVRWLMQLVQTWYDDSHQSVTLLKQEQAHNSDSCGWIVVDGLGVDYPILRHETDDTYYLYRNAAREETPYGSIFLESVNQKNFSDRVTIVYGHAMRDGSMFGSLHQLLQPEVFETHERIHVSTPQGVRTYRIFAVHSHTTEHLYHTYALFDAQRAEDYVQGVASMAHSHGGLTRDIPLGDAPILVLSTCEDDIGSSRLLVHAVLESETIQ